MSNNTFIHDASQHEVHAVTVYQSNEAEVRRKFNLNLKAGQNTVVVEQLPSSIDTSQNRLRVECTGDVEVREIIYHSPEIDRSRKISDDYQKLKHREEFLEAELAILDRESNTITNYSWTWNGESKSVKELMEVFQIVAAKERELNNTRAQLKKALQEIKDQLQPQSKLVEIDEDFSRKVKITVVLMAGASGPSEICLDYIVSGVSWAPQYDLYASISTDQKMKVSIALKYQAAIIQSTGENWSNVKLSLSTATPLQGSAIPSLKPRFLELDEDEEETDYGESDSEGGDAPASKPPVAHAPPISHVIVDTLSEVSTQPSMRRKKLHSRDSFRKLPQRSTELVKRPAISSFLQVSDDNINSGISTSFTVPMLITIPSSHDNFERHVILLKKVQIDSTETEWITVPKEKQIAFFQCKLKNETGLVFLPGEANVFMNGTFATVTQIPNVNPQESFLCSLSPDPAVRVTYHPQTKKVKITGEDEATASITTFQQIISIQNMHQIPLHKLVIRDQIPVSHVESVVVRVHQPKELSLSKNKGPKQPAQHNTDVYWIQTNGEPIKTNESGDIGELGLIEWVKNVDAGTSINIDLVWDVKASTDVSWIEK